MINAEKMERAKKIWSNHNTNIVFILIVIIFFSYALFIALNLKTGIIPDEITHYIFSKHFSTTFGIPPDTPVTYARGVYIKHNPFFYYWINGRIINLLKVICPNFNYRQMLVSLRIVNVIYASGTVFLCYLLSKELIKNKWYQLLPPFLLTNTIMFVFLAGGVNYDNLTNLFCMAGLYFLARVFNHESFIINSLSWIIFISAGTLTKFTVLPLGLAMLITWLYFLLKHRKKIISTNFNKNKVLILSFISLLLILGNLTIYGYNLLKFQAITPPCESILTKEQCSIGIFQKRLEEEGLEQKLSIPESKNLGYPGPIEYLFTQWIPLLFFRIFGVLGHRYHYLVPETMMHLLLFLWILILSLVYWKDTRLINISFMSILLFYGIILFLKNYNIELVFGFKHYALQGRYIFPVIGIAHILLTLVLILIPRKTIRIPTLILTILLYFISGPLTFIYRYNAVFSDWFVK